MNLQPSASRDKPFQPEDVQLHLTTLRIEQREVGKFVGAMRDLSESQEALLERFLADNSDIVAGTRADPRFRKASERLLRRYLELARRHNMTIPCEKSCHVVFHELTREFRLNCSSLKLPPDKLVTATLLSEHPLRELRNDAKLSLFIHRFPGIIERAVTSAPADPQAYLHDIASRFTVCFEHEARTRTQRLTDFTILFLAKTHRDMDPLERLALFRREQQSLLASDEFRPLRDIFSKETSRSRFIEGLLSRFKVEECRDHLRRTGELYRQIYEDPSFAQLRDRRADILVALQRYGEDTKKFLSTMLTQESRIARLAALCGEPMTPRELRVLCLRAPGKARVLEEALMERSAQS